MPHSLLYELISDIRNRTISARYVFKQLRDGKINEVQAIIDLGKELDKIDKVLSDCELSIHETFLTMGIHGSG